LSIVFAYYAAGAAALFRGEFDRAITMLERALKTCEAAEIPVQRPLVVSGLAVAYAFVGRFGEALRLLETSSDHRALTTEGGTQQVPLGKALGMVWDVETYLLAGRYSTAEALACQALAVLGKSKHRGSEAWLIYLIGEILARRDPPDLIQGESNYKAAMILAQDLGMRPVLAHCHLGLGQIHTRGKNAQLARSNLHSARELYRAMSMPFWLGRVDRALAVID
jgi:tetratricopeptide (TPR) repeat protein